MLSNWNPFCSSVSGSLEEEQSALSLPLSKARQEYSTSDALIADALQRLSLDDRDRIYHDIHGVADEIDESPEFVASSLAKMQEQLVAILLNTNSTLPCQAIQIAEEKDSEYVNDPTLRLAFLRADGFVASKAAARMVRFFDFKLLLFGESKLCQQITLDDLEAQDMALFKTGYYQILPQRDRAGRRVDVHIQAAQKFASPESLGRVLFVKQTKDLSEKEVVNVAVHLRTPTKNYGKGSRITEMYSRGASDLPMKISSIHYCVQANRSPLLRLYGKLLVKTIELTTRARIKIHRGSYTEWMYSLMTYGIPHLLIPVTADGEIKVKNHLEYLKMWQTQVKYIKQGKLDTTLLPLPSDVLFGRGKPIREHTGNLRFHAIVEELSPRYKNATPNSEKAALVDEVLEMVKGAPGRFLSKDCGIWLEVDDAMARDKVVRLFRTQRRWAKQRNDQEMNGNGGATPRGSILDGQSTNKRFKI